MRSNLARLGLALSPSLAAGLFLFVAAARAQPRPLGPEFQVNTHTPGHQYDPQLAFGPGGEFVVVWASGSSGGTDHDHSSIQARRFSADGTPLDPADLQVNTLTTGYQWAPAVAAAPDGNFVISWSSYASAGDDQHLTSIQARRFASDGTPLDPVEFQVNTLTTGYQFFSDLGVDAAGGFVVVWTDTPAPTLFNVRARRFTAAGTPLDPVDLDVSGSPAEWGLGSSAIGVRPGGEFVVVWRDACTRTDGCYGVWGRRFDAGGSPLDPFPFVVNSVYDIYVHTTDVAVDAAGGFVVSWNSEIFVPQTGYQNVWARRFAWPVVPLGPQPVLVNSPMVAEENFPSVALDSASNFVVVWSAFPSSGGDTSYFSVQGRRFHADGTGQDSGGFQLNSITTSNQIRPAVAVDSRGRVVVAWESLTSAGGDSDGLSIQARRFLGLPFFSDGFETGNASRWSAMTTPAPPLR